MYCLLLFPIIMILSTNVIALLSSLFSNASSLGFVCVCVCQKDDMQDIGVRAIISITTSSKSGVDPQGEFNFWQYTFFLLFWMRTEKPYFKSVWEWGRSQIGTRFKRGALKVFSVPETSSIPVWLEIQPRFPSLLIGVPKNICIWKTVSLMHCRRINSNFLFQRKHHQG